MHVACCDGRENEGRSLWYVQCNDDGRREEICTITPSVEEDSQRVSTLVKIKDPDTGDEESTYATDCGNDRHKVKDAALLASHPSLLVEYSHLLVISSTKSRK